MLRTVSIAALAAAMLSAAVVPAMAQSAEVSRHSRVYIGDVDRYSRDGADEILSRIDDASHRVCTEPRSVSPRTGSDERAECRTEATERAVADVGSGVVTARYLGIEPQVIITDDGNVVKNK